MSIKTLEQLCGQKREELSLQLAMQCAPLLLGLKCANLFTVQRGLGGSLKALCAGSRYSVLPFDEESRRPVYYLYQREALEEYLSLPEVSAFLREAGYQGLSLEEMLLKCAAAYQAYCRKQAPFPHETGLFLGYPAEDVKGFIEHNGKNFLYAGYWKVYADLPKKLMIFGSYEHARDRLLRKVALGITPEQMLGTASGVSRHYVSGRDQRKKVS